MRMSKLACCLGILFAAGTCFSQMFTVTDLGTLSGGWSEARGINLSGQVVGNATINNPILEWPESHPFRTSPNSPIKNSDDFWGRPCYEPYGIDCIFPQAYAINDSGQVAGSIWFEESYSFLAFRTKPNGPLDSSTVIWTGTAYDVNATGQAVVTVQNWWSPTSGYITAPNGSTNEPIYLGTFASDAPLMTTARRLSMEGFKSNGVWHDLNKLIPAGSSCTGVGGVALNNLGQIAANGNCGGQQHAVRLNPIYKGFVQPPINVDGSSVFRLSGRSFLGSSQSLNTSCRTAPCRPPLRSLGLRTENSHQRRKVFTRHLLIMAQTSELIPLLASTSTILERRRWELELTEWTLVSMGLWLGTRCVP